MLEKHSESEVHVDKLEQGPASSIAFGLERLGLIAVQAPIVSCIVLLALIVGAVFGIQRIKIDDSLSQLLSGHTLVRRSTDVHPGAIGVEHAADPACHGESIHPVE